MLTAERTRRVLEESMARLRPHLPDGVDVHVATHAGLTTIQRSDAGWVQAGPLRLNQGVDEQGRPTGGSARTDIVRKLGTWIPFLPHDLRCRLAAQDAVEQLLDLVYAPPGGALTGVECDVTATSTETGVVISYQPPTSAAERIELRPLPWTLF